MQTSRENLIGYSYLKCSGKGKIRIFNFSLIANKNEVVTIPAPLINFRATYMYMI